MGSIHQNNVLGRSEGSFKQRAKPMAVHRGHSSLRNSVTLGRSEEYCESPFLRNGAAATPNSAATSCHPRNNRHSCLSSINFRTSCHFHDRLPVHDEHAEGGSRSIKCSQASAQRRDAIQSACDCVRHGREHCENIDVQAVEGNMCYHRGHSVSDTQAGHGYSHAVDDCGCCCGPSTRCARNDGADATFDDRMRASGGSHCFSKSEDLTHRTTANGFISSPSSASRKVPTKVSRSDPTSVANSTQASREQVIFYGWFLKRPTSGSGTQSCSTLPQVAIGGYKNAGMLESDYCESGPIVQRLERWRLRTSEGLEVGLIGVINIAKSVANGFPTALAQCFMIGFPSAWIYMISNFCSEPPSGGPTDLPSSSASPSNAREQPQDTKDHGREAPLNTVTLEADPVRKILSSSLFIAPEDTSMRTLRRLSSTNNVPLHSGVVSDATSVPQSVDSQDGLDESRNDNDSCYGAINPCHHSARYDPVLPPSSEDPVPQNVQLEVGGEHPARLGDGLQDNDNSTIPKEELVGEGVAGLINPVRTPNEEAQLNIDCEAWLGDGNSRYHEDEARVRICYEVNILQEGLICGAALGNVSNECTCASVPDLKPTCPSCCAKVGLGGIRFSAGDMQDRESKAAVNVKGRSDEKLSNRVDETGKPSAVVSKDSSDTTRKRSSQELEPEEEANRQSKMLCGTHTSITVIARFTTGKEANGTDSAEPVAGGPDACLMQESAPCTPVQDSKKRPRDATETLGADEEVLDGGLCDCNANESVVQTGAEQVEEEMLGTLGDLIAAEPEDRKRSSAGPSVPPSENRASDVEVLDIVVEPIVDTGTEPCEEEINVAPKKDLIVTASKNRRKRRKVVGTYVLRSQMKVPVEEYSDSGVERNVVENLNSSVSVTRSRRRRAAAISPPSEGEESDAVSGVGCSDGTDKGANHVLTSDRELEVVNDAEHLCEESKQSKAVPYVASIDGTGEELDHVLKSDRELGKVTDAEHVCKQTEEVLSTPNKKYNRRYKRYYKQGRRGKKKYSKKGGPVEKETSTNHDIRGSSAEEMKTDTKGDSRDSNPLYGLNYTEAEADHCAENPREEIPVPVRQKHQHRTTRNSCRSRKSKSHGRDSEMQSLGDGPGDAADSESRRHLKESERVTKPSKGLRKAADRCSSLSRRASPKPPDQGVEESQTQKRRVRSRASIVPPPPPRPRVLDKTKVPEAFGLKKSRHGRVLVPRLATWRNQSIKYDMDGSIIAIAEGYQGLEVEAGTGFYKYKPPSDKEARSMQRKLRKAAELV